MLISQKILQKSQTSYNSFSFKNNLENKNEVNKNLITNLNISSCVRINFVVNNIFCTFWSISGKRTFRSKSAGMKKFKPSKRRLVFYGKLFFESFFRELQQWRKKYRNNGSFFYFSLKVPKRFRKIILKYISRKTAIINFEYSKAFNGCKAKKKRRKKRLGFRFFK